MHCTGPRPYRALGEEHGVTEVRARMMARVARIRYRRIFRRVLKEHGVSPEAVDRTIQEMLEEM